MDQERFDQLKAKASGPGLSDDEAGELGRLYAEAEGKGYADHTAVSAEGAELDPRIDAEEVHRIKAELHEGDFETADKAAYTKRESWSNMYGAAVQVHEGDEEIGGKY